MGVEKNRIFKSKEEQAGRETMTSAIACVDLTRAGVTTRRGPP